MRRLAKSPEALILLVSIWVTLTCNAGYWSVVAANAPAGSPPGTAHFVSIGILTVGLSWLILSLLAIGRMTRPILSAALIAGSAAGYFTARFGVLFDNGMLVNLVQTNRAEALELLSPALALNIFFRGLIPAIVIWFYPLESRGLPLAVLQRGLAAVLALALIVGPLFIDQKEIFSLARNHREIRHMIAPLNLISASYVYARDRLSTPDVFRRVATDAVHASETTASGRPYVHVLVIGETARALSFSLDGYSRTTNPKLGKHRNLGFLHAASCGTATAVSLPCMFSVREHAGFDRAASQNEDNLLDIAARAGYEVHWIDNGNTCKGVCSRVDSRDVHQLQLEHLCSSDGCYDEILVHELSRLLPQLTNDSLIVLHQLGSHGPGYYRRYPDAFRTFLPDCRSQNLDECSSEEIVNSYDNTILYTDHVISRTIDTLEAQSARVDSSLIYISDHGESLGEHHLYLHGMPYRFAPSEQTQVPMITWTSGGTTPGQGLPSPCLDRLISEPVSHDNLFHTELGLLGIRTAVYRPALDIYSACRDRSNAGSSSRAAVTVNAVL